MGLQELFQLDAMEISGRVLDGSEALVGSCAHLEVDYGLVVERSGSAQGGHVLGLRDELPKPKKKGKSPNA